MKQLEFTTVLVSVDNTTRLYRRGEQRQGDGGLPVWEPVDTEKPFVFKTGTEQVLKVEHEGRRSEILLVKPGAREVTVTLEGGRRHDDLKTVVPGRSQIDIAHLEMAGVIFNAFSDLREVALTPGDQGSGSVGGNVTGGL